MAGTARGEPGRAFDRTMGEVCRLKPDTLRIYPTVVLRGTELERMAREGLYAPLTVEEAVEWVAPWLPSAGAGRDQGDPGRAARCQERRRAADRRRLSPGVPGAVRWVALSQADEAGTGKMPSGSGRDVSGVTPRAFQSGRAEAGKFSLGRRERVSGKTAAGSDNSARKPFNFCYKFDKKYYLYQFYRERMKPCS